MQRASKFNHFTFASLVHYSALVAAQFLHFLATATALLLSLLPHSLEPPIQLAPVPICPNMHAHVANSVFKLEGQSC